MEFDERGFESASVHGEHLAAARAALDLSLQQFAQLCGTSPLRVKRWEETRGPIHATVTETNNIVHTLSKAGIELTSEAG
ncbi:MAG: hypothetical protein JNK30_13680, partial [Phenylobacterium sp.]|uniref:hypothetical protein n=1 Tax=Phenylobacterium sp. TaxID=1871053 RepID=UPI001A4B9076